MKKCLSILLLFALSLLYSSCGAASEQAEPEESGGYYWRAEASSRYPLGLDGRISGVAAGKERIYVCGSQDGVPCLASMDYEIEGGVPSLSEASLRRLSELPAGSRAISVSYGAGSFYLLLGIPGAVGEPESYLVTVYSPDGAVTAAFPVGIDAGDAARRLLVLDDGGFWLCGLHNIRLYAADGTEEESFTQEEEDFCSLLMIGGEPVFQTFDYQSHEATLSRFDRQNHALTPVECNYRFSAPSAVCQSAIGSPLINTGSQLFAVGRDYTVSQVADWDALLGARTLYRQICQLGEDVFLLVPRALDEIYDQMQGVSPGDSGELIYMARSYVPDNRRPVRIAFYGQASQMLGVLESQYAHISPDHKVICLDYGSDEAGLARLMRDVTAAGEIDIVLSDGYSVEPGAAFADLYPFIDRDAGLSREDFVPQVLAGIERGGELREIWSGFTLYALEAFGPLAEGPVPLRLADCAAYLDSASYTEPMFSDWMTKTELLACLAPGLLNASYNAGTACYELDSEDTRALLALCRGRPSEAPLEDAYFSEVLGYHDLQPDYLDNLISSGRAFRLFDGSDGGDSFTSLVCDYRSGYLIPAACPDKENAWSFLRILLSADWQLKEFSQRRICYPSNAAALERVLRSYNAPQTYRAVYALIRTAALETLDCRLAERIFIESVQPYLYGDADLDAVLSNAQGKLNIFSAERRR